MSIPGDTDLPPRGFLDYISRVDNLLILILRALEGLRPGAIPPTVIIAPPDRYEIPIGVTQRLSTASTEYVALASWKIPTDRFGIFSFVEMDSENFSTTRWKLDAAGKVLFTDLQLNSSLTQEYPGVKLAPGSEVILSVKATSGTIIVYGDIVGKEIPK